MFGFACGLAHRQDRGRRSHGVCDANESLLRYMPAACPSESKDGRANKGESQAKPIRAGAMGIHPNQDRDSRTESGNLRQCEVHKDHATLHHVHTKIRMNASQDKTGHKRPNQELQNLHVAPSPYWKAFLSKAIS